MKRLLVCLALVGAVVLPMALRAAQTSGSPVEEGLRLFLENRLDPATLLITYSDIHPFLEVRSSASAAPVASKPGLFGRKLNLRIDCLVCRSAIWSSYCSKSRLGASSLQIANLASTRAAHASPSRSAATPARSGSGTTT
jgi:hypothetical protein